MIYVTKNRDGDVMFESEADSFIQHIETLVASRKSLAYANLQGVNLQRANLRGVDLRWTNLQGANLQGANLRWANLRGANLQGVDLRGANLQGANMRGAVTIVQGLEWGIYLTNGYMRIGCEGHTLRAWEDFSAEEINAMHEKASQFWREYKDFLIKECKKLG